MKKILMIILPLLLISGCTSKEVYNEVSYKKLNEMLENKESFVLVIGSSECSHCESYKLTMKDVVDKYKITINYIDIFKLSDTERAKLNNKFSYSGTPTTVFVEKGKEENAQFNRINGAKDYETIVKKLKKNGYIK